MNVVVLVADKVSGRTVPIISSVYAASGHGPSENVRSSIMAKYDGTPSFVELGHAYWMYSFVTGSKGTRVPLSGFVVPAGVITLTFWSVTNVPAASETLDAFVVVE
jgi:hypothetical protein